MWNVGLLNKLKTKNSMSVIIINGVIIKNLF